MPLRRLLSLACPAMCAACLAAGYAPRGPWLALLALAITAPAWLAARRWPSTWATAAALVLAVILAALGALAGALPGLMTAGAALALASWDLVRFDHLLAGAEPSEQVARLESSHYRHLALAIVPSLLIITAGQIIRWQVPFAVMIVLVILAVYSLDRIWRLLGD